MTLTDASALIALINVDDRDHHDCRNALDDLRFPLLTTWPALTEAMHVLARGGWPAQATLWRLVQRGDLVIDSPGADVPERAAELMEKYADLPMDLADATLVALADERGMKRIFTLDSDFHVYRLASGKPLTVVPA
jgi:predicted nucleic acid-binding protein